jgi:putative hydrolase of the HAD superfamily
MARQFVLLDVDNTLYSRACGVIDRVDVLINRYLVERLGVAEDEVDRVRRDLWREYGTTLHGLMWRGPVDREDYLAYVHAVDLESLVAPDGALGRMLGGIRLMKVAVTNGSRAHARAVLSCLGIGDLFFAVYGLEQLGWVPKPYVQAYQTVLRHLHARADECVLVEDSGANLRTARQLGMATVHVADGHPPDPAADAVIPSIHALPAALASLDGR